MKNKLLTKSVVIVSAIGILASCSKNKDSNTDQLATLGKATISGRISAKLVDTVGAAPIQYVPAGKVITAWIDSKDLVLQPDNGATYARKYYSAISDANGYYSITVDVSKYKPATVSIDANDFEADVMKKNVGGPDHGKIYYDRHVFSNAPVAPVVVNNDQKVITDISFN